MCRFFSKTLIKRVQPGQRQTIENEGREGKKTKLSFIVDFAPLAAAAASTGSFNSVCLLKWVGINLCLLQITMCIAI